MHQQQIFRSAASSPSINVLTHGLETAKEPAKTQATSCGWFWVCNQLWFIGRAVPSGEHFTKVKHVSIRVADGEIFHIPWARRERIQDFYTRREELGLEGFCGAFSEM